MSDEALKKVLAALGVGVLFALAVVGLGLYATTLDDPWGVIVLVVVAPGMPFLGARGDSIVLGLVAVFLVWTLVGALIWAGVVRPLIAARRQAER